jgi:SAM-dependent methyltransferase
MGLPMEKERVGHDADSRAASDWRDEYVRKYYLDVAGTPDPADLWIKLVQDHVPAGARVLEIGGGPVDWTTSVMRGSATEIVGLDIDKVISENRFLDQAVVYNGLKFPLPDGRFNAVVSRWVNEHIENPEVHFAEIHRILAPGGVYVFRTVNVFHYKTIGAFLLPDRVHGPLVKWLRNMSTDEHEPYPTYFRANTRGRITKLCSKTGLVPVSLELSEFYPSYGMGSKLLFRVLMQYERLVNSSEIFQFCRHTIDCVLKKPN